MHPASGRVKVDTAKNPVLFIEVEIDNKGKKTFLQVASWVLAAGIIAAILLLLDLPALGERLASTDLASVAGVVVLMTLLLVIKGLRWWIIVSTRRKAPAWRCVRLAIVAMFLNAFIPLRGGDVVRGLLLARETGLPRSQALGTVALDKIYDMFSLGVVVVPLLFLGGLPDWIRWPPVATVSAAFLLLAAGIVLRLRMRRRGESVEKSPWIVRTLAGFAMGFDSVLRPGPVVLCVAISIVQWVVLIGTVILALHAVDIRPTLGTSAVCLLAVQFAAGVPLTPSAAGTMHGAIVAVLAAVGVDPETGMGAAVVYHAATTLPIVLLGVPLARGTAFEQAADK